MAYQIDYRIIDYTGRKTDANNYVIAHESGNPNNVGPNSLENEVKYMQSQAAKGGAFTSHWVGSGGKIIQIAPVGKIQYGAGGVANPKSFAQVELARTNDAATFKKDYAAYVWLLRMLAAECGIPQTLDTTGKGIKTHLWVTKNLGNTTHTDPYGYLNSWGISNAQFAKDITNGLENTITPVTPAPTPTPAPPKPASKWVAESGTFSPNFAINVRSAPNTSAGIVATYNKGESVRYDSYYNDGRYVWIHYKSFSGHDRYMVCRENGTAWGSFS